MNPRIKKVIDDIEKTKVKIDELQALLPELERKKKDLEDAEIIKLVRNASVAPGALYSFMDSLKSTNIKNTIKPDIQATHSVSESTWQTTHINVENTPED